MTITELPVGTRAWLCPNDDHDGVRVPTTRYIDAQPAVGLTINGQSRIEAARCEYCAEGLAARLIREGWRVTVWAVLSCTCPELPGPGAFDGPEDHAAACSGCPLHGTIVQA